MPPVPLRRPSRLSASSGPPSPVRPTRAGTGDQGVQLRPLRIAGVADAQALVIPLRPWGIGVERESAALGCAVGPGVGQGIMLGLVGGSARGATAQIFQADTDGAAPAAGQALAPLTRGAAVRSLSRQGIGDHVVRDGDMQKRAHSRRGGGVPVQVDTGIPRHHHRIGEGARGTEGRLRRNAYSSSWVRIPSCQVQERTYSRVSMPAPGASSRLSSRSSQPLPAP